MGQEMTHRDFTVRSRFPAFALSVQGRVPDDLAARLRALPGYQAMLVSGLGDELRTVFTFELEFPVVEESRALLERYYADVTAVDGTCEVTSSGTYFVPVKED